jgi:hypothetical protein
MKYSSLVIHVFLFLILVTFHNTIANAEQLSSISSLQHRGKQYYYTISEYEIGLRDKVMIDLLTNKCRVGSTEACRELNVLHARISEATRCGQNERAACQSLRKKCGQGQNWACNVLLQIGY